MKTPIGRILITLSLGSAPLLIPYQANTAEPGDASARAERSFDRLSQPHAPEDSTRPVSGSRPPAEEGQRSYSSEHYWIGNGHGDLAKGKMVCQRVSELSARTDLAKQIRVMVKEHLVDRVRERSGHETEQDIELTREEIVQEYLLGVKIIDRQIDEEHNVCTATAVMLKSPRQPKQAADSNTAAPTTR